ncbi:MAG: L-lactate dehydrogenase [Endomicrobium sp.]|jgi:L-lactate dehydrogenase|nr:L-lactate dehydrogenase [Endomicrobium sp.]
MEKLARKVSIIGCGKVGMRYAYSMVIKGLARELCMVDYYNEIAEGEAMDLADGGPFLSSVDVYSGDYADIAGSELVIITAGAGRKPGQSRIDLVKGNAEIIKSIVPQIIKYAPSAIILVVSNPVDILSYVTYKISGKPSNEIIGSGTLLDTARLINLLKKLFDVNLRSIYAPVFGEHGDTAFPAWSKATIGGVPLEDAFEAFNGKDMNYKEEIDRIFREVKDRGKEIIKRKGETSYGIGLSMTRISKAILKNEKSALSVSTYLEDYHGVGDVYLSVPAIVGKRGIEKVLKVRFNEEEMNAFKHSAQSVKQVIKEIGF